MVQNCLQEILECLSALDCCSISLSAVKYQLRLHCVVTGMCMCSAGDAEWPNVFIHNSKYRIKLLVLIYDGWMDGSHLYCLLQLLGHRTYTKDE